MNLPIPITSRTVRLVALGAIVFFGYLTYVAIHSGIQAAYRTGIEQITLLVIFHFRHELVAFYRNNFTVPNNCRCHCCSDKDEDLPFYADPTCRWERQGDTYIPVTLKKRGF